MKACVEKLLTLLANGGDNGRIAVAGVNASNAAGKVQEHVAVDVGQSGAGS